MIEIKEILYRYQKGLGKRAIARSLGIARNTIRDIITTAKVYGLKKDSTVEEIEEISEQVQRARYPDKLRSGSTEARLQVYHKLIEEWRVQPYMTIKQMYRLLSKEGVKVSESALWRYVSKHFGSKVLSTVRMPTFPGKQAQVDFGYVGKMYNSVSKKAQKAYAFVMTLSHSRYRFVRFVFKQDEESWIDCHIRAFEFFGGVAETIVLDNLKSGVEKADFYDPKINRSYAELERHYGFVADPARIRRPTHKGKVERSILIVKQQLIAGNKYVDINEANERALQWCGYEIAQRVCSSTGQTPWHLFTSEEKGALLPLPKSRYERAGWHILKVHRDQHIVLRGSFYSVPYSYIGREVVVRCGNKLVC